MICLCPGQNGLLFPGKDIFSHVGSSGLRDVSTYAFCTILLGAHDVKQVFLTERVGARQYCWPCPQLTGVLSEPLAFSSFETILQQREAKRPQLFLPQCGLVARRSDISPSLPSKLSQVTSLQSDMCQSRQIRSGRPLPPTPSLLHWLQAQGSQDPGKEPQTDNMTYNFCRAGL